MATKTIAASVDAYERWLKAQLAGEFVEADRQDKHDKMRKGPFPFLRATYWRWAETILEACPDLKHAPAVLAVGDIHLENFGTWRDVDARLIWGVNDFDEAAEMPYVLDLVRLAVSAILARKSSEPGTKEICAAIWEGYGKGLQKPEPFVLDEEHTWLRECFIATDDDRIDFWQKMGALEPSPKPPAARYREAIVAALPERGIELDFRPRTAGTGSLGRPRWVGIGSWRGGRLVREAKALVISGWTLAFDASSKKLYVEKIASGKYRAPDPWYRVIGNVVVRRLSPNSHKIEVKHDAETLLDARMLRVMGHELANVHLGTDGAEASVQAHFSKRDAGWLQNAATAAAKLVSDEYEEWKAR